MNLALKLRLLALHDHEVVEVLGEGWEVVLDLLIFSLGPRGLEVLYFVEGGRVVGSTL